MARSKSCLVALNEKYGGECKQRHVTFLDEPYLNRFFPHQFLPTRKTMRSQIFITSPKWAVSYFVLSTQSTPHRDFFSVRGRTCQIFLLHPEHLERSVLRKGKGREPMSRYNVIIVYSLPLSLISQCKKGAATIIATN